MEIIRLRGGEMQLILTRSLNGIPINYEEIKRNTFKCEAVSTIIREVNQRISKTVPTNDKIKKIC